MGEERTNLVPRLQQDAYLHYLAAAQPGILDSAEQARNLNLTQNPVANAFDANDAQFSSATGLARRYPSDFSRSSTFPQSVRNHDVINKYGNNSYVPSTESNNFAQGLPAAGIPNRYLADPFDDPNTLSFDANTSLSGQPSAFGTGALNLTAPTYAEGRYDGVPAALQYYSDPSNYNEHPFATDAAFIGTNTFATGSASYTNGQAIANNPVPMPLSNNPIVPLDIGLMTEGPIALSPNIYNTGQASANHPFSMHASNNPIVPIDIGFTTNGPFALSPNIYNTGQASANHPFSMHASNNPIVPIDIGFTTDGPFALSPNIYNTGQASASNPLPIPTSNSALIPVDIGPPIPQRALCPECNQTFGRQSDLDRHADKHQSGPKEFKCPIGGCDYGSYRKDKLGEHVRRRHPARGAA